MRISKEKNTKIYHEGNIYEAMFWIKNVLMAICYPESLLIQHEAFTKLKNLHQQFRLIKTYKLQQLVCFIIVFKQKSVQEFSEFAVSVYWANVSEFKFNYCEKCHITHALLEYQNHSNIEPHSELTINVVIYYEKILCLQFILQLCIYLSQKVLF